ncbi:MAG: hypothetical protein WA765_11465 [Candidatus Acidiferrum sp.]
MTFFSLLFPFKSLIPGLPAFLLAESKLMPFLFEERCVEIGTVNLRMTQHARLEKACLIVKRRHARRAAETGCRVALQAKQIDVADLQHVRIRPAVRQMARLASIDLYGSVLVYKRSLFVDVTFEADGVLRRGSPHLLGAHRTVHVVTITALHQPFIHSMMERHFELSFLLEMACEAKLGLGLDEQKLRFFCVVGRMAGNAADVILRVDRVDDVHVLRAAGMTGQAARVDLLCRGLLECEDLGLVPAAVNVGLARTMAAFAAVPLWAFLGIQSGHKVR